MCWVGSAYLHATRCHSPLASPGTEPGTTAPGACANACTAGAADTPAEAVISPPAIVVARCGARCLNAAVAAFTAVSESILTALGRGSLGGGTGASAVDNSTISPEESDDRLDVLLFERLRVSQAGSLRGTSTGVVACASISPVLERVDWQGQPLIRTKGKDDAQPIFFIAILNFFQLQRYLPPFIWAITFLSSTSRAFALSPR